MFGTIDRCKAFIARLKIEMPFVIGTVRFRIMGCTELIFTEFDFFRRLVVRNLSVPTATKSLFTFRIEDGRVGATDFDTVDLKL